MNRYPIIRKIYLYLFAIVGLFMMTVGSARLVTLALKMWVFTKADELHEYPAARSVKIPVGEGGAEFREPSKEEIDEYQRNQRTSQRQREAAESLAWIIVGAPLYLYHWRMIQKDKMEEIRDEK